MSELPESEKDKLPEVPAVVPSPEELEEEDRFPREEYLLSLKDLPEEKLLQELSLLDAQGLLLAPGETLDAFVERLLRERRNIDALNKELAETGEAEPLIGLKLKNDGRIPLSLLEEGLDVTAEKYGFAAKWVPGFFPSSGLGVLWGGCSISSTEETPTLFLIRSSFRKKEKYFIYSRKELISHESCHAVRVPIGDMTYEEHFAYAISSSPLRRYTGNCFKSEKDAILFLLPVFLLLLIQIMRVSFTPDLPAWPFWILAFVWPAFLVFVNIRERKQYFKAETALKEAGVNNPSAVLFRCGEKEIVSFAACKSTQETEALLREKSREDLRWKVIAARFVSPVTETPENGKKEEE